MTERNALFLILLDPLSTLSHGALATAKEALGIEHVPFEHRNDFFNRVRTAYVAEQFASADPNRGKRPE